MQSYWYKNAILYGIDIWTFKDSNGDGIGDLGGVIELLDYLADLGVTCLWLLPFYPTPYRDNGYDVQDYYNLDPRIGTLDDYAELVRQANRRGLRVLTDLVANHTSDRHPWFQASRRDPTSRYRDYYVWSEFPVPTKAHNIFPGVEEDVWTYDELAKMYYFHLFYHFEPGLKFANPDVQSEFQRIMEFWLSFGGSGFRIDAAPHMVEQKGLLSTRPEEPLAILKRLYDTAASRREDVVLLGETDVEIEKIGPYFQALNMLFSFFNSEFLFLTFAQQRPDRLIEIVQRQQKALAEKGQWVNFLRNLDELDMDQLTAQEQQLMFQTYAPEERMRLYGRGIRRRAAPMLGGDRARMEMAFSLLFSLPGAPAIMYGDEIGMGDDLSLRERDSVRTLMQWSGEDNGGFSTASLTIRPAVWDPPFGYPRVNAAEQQKNPDSFLNWMKRLCAARRACPEIGLGKFAPLETDDPAVMAHAMRGGRTVAALHNLKGEDARVQVNLPVPTGGASKLFGPGDVTARQGNTITVDLPRYGYLWLLA